MIVDLEELRTVQTRERATDGLQELRDSFYADVAEYIESLRAERNEAAAQADDPFRSPRVNDLTDEIETAEQVAEAIYERRIGKLVKQASLAAAGMPDDQQGLTAEEQELYDSIVARIEENKESVLATLSGETTDPATDSNDESPADSGPGQPPGSEPESGTEGTAAAAMMDPDASEPPEPSDSPDESPEDVEESSDDAQDTPSIERTKVRVTEDIGEIFGVDERAYTLQSDDVVDLPKENADPLVDRDAAERLE